MSAEFAVVVGALRLAAKKLYDNNATPEEALTQAADEIEDAMDRIDRCRMSGGPGSRIVMRAADIRKGVFNPK